MRGWKRSSTRLRLNPEGLFGKGVFRRKEQSFPEQCSFSSALSPGCQRKTLHLCHGCYWGPQKVDLEAEFP